MDVYRTLREAREAGPQPSVVTIGNFDGVHRGHQALLERAGELAAGLEPRARVVTLTFEPHPVRFFRPGREPFELTTLRQRLDLLAAHGAAAAMVLTFDEELSQLEPEAFVDQILVEALGTRGVVVGQGFRFGHERAGTTEVIEQLGQERGFELAVCEPVERHGQVISSTRIREHVRAGRVDQIPALLTRPYRIWGRVVRGDARGRELGYPTANVASENELLPADGIYTTTLTAGQPWGELPSITYIGQRPTYEEEATPGRTVETFVLGWPAGESLDLYERRVGIAFHEHLRPDRAFESSEALVAQMEQDVARARAWHGLDEGEAG